jgi:hypothetical protein
MAVPYILEALTATYMRSNYFPDTDIRRVLCFINYLPMHCYFSLII